ncbi:MAG: dynamin family protein [Pseudonocardia sp.]|nr:dynamin family protein [Pseudonocardia sp.]
MSAGVTGALSAAVGAVLGQAVEVYADEPATARWLHGHLVRLDEPLRVAIAGKVKAGKSTLLNALVGEQVAPTDAGECTRVVTWYRDGPHPRITLHPRSGQARPLPVRRHDGALVIDLPPGSAEEVERLTVDWPSQSLRATTLIDTPGMSSLSAHVARRSVMFLQPDDDTPTEADAVVYLMRHLHAADAQFLEAFRDQGVARAASVNTVGVISRADEIGGGRIDAMFSANAVARRYRTEPALHGLCQNVVAVAGLLAQTGRTLRQAEFAVLAELSRVPREDLDSALLIADRFGVDGGALPAGGAAVPAAQRHELLGRFGVFGVRLGTALIRQGVGTAAGLATELVRRSGLHELQDVLQTQFGQRRDVLKARSGLLALDSVLRADPRPGSEWLTAEVERILTGAHEFVELRLLSALRGRAVVLPVAMAREAERLLGEAGAAPATRLGLPVAADRAEVGAAAADALARWQDHAENPMLSRTATDACRVVIRTCEGMLDAVSTG